MLDFRSGTDTSGSNCESAAAIGDTVSMGLPRPTDSTVASEPPRVTALDMSWTDCLKTVSSELGVSARTVQRRLSRSGQGFRHQRDRLRKERAAALLRETALPIADIARDLGFSEAASFSRAFRRWFGVPPIRFRSGEGDSQQA